MTSPYPTCWEAEVSSSGTEEGQELHVRKTEGGWRRGPAFPFLASQVLGEGGLDCVSGKSGGAWV